MDGNKERGLYPITESKLAEVKYDKIFHSDKIEKVPINIESEKKRINKLINELTEPLTFWQTMEKIINLPSILFNLLVKIIDFLLIIQGIKMEGLKNWKTTIPALISTVLYILGALNIITVPAAIATGITVVVLFLIMVFSDGASFWIDYKAQLRTVLSATILILGYFNILALPQIISEGLIQLSIIIVGWFAKDYKPNGN